MEPLLMEKREPDQEKQLPSHDAPAIPSTDEDEVEADEIKHRNRVFMVGLHPLRSPPRLALRSAAAADAVSLLVCTG
ncbi:hypothetical protein GUJ93_ZPchr0013g36308 [Zizania palustris]|uniref:Uncharacterized protein n=1 Tax=Zizania palustris TaxID=103762 RepID=A0A8J6BY99_ZIZPA|nr:hypothetical protein GUJ93_ZPchr0013g36308 [Zizania palustris]